MEAVLRGVEVVSTREERPTDDFKAKEIGF